MVLSAPLRYGFYLFTIQALEALECKILVFHCFNEDCNAKALHFDTKLLYLFAFGTLIMAAK